MLPWETHSRVVTGFEHPTIEYILRVQIVSDFQANLTDPLVQIQGPSRFTVPWSTVFIVVAYVSIFFLGLVGNSLVILTLTRNKRVKVCIPSTAADLPVDNQIMRKRTSRHLIAQIRAAELAEEIRAMPGRISRAQISGSWRYHEV